MSGLRDMGFSPICDPQDFFFKIGPLWCPNFMQKIRKNQWAVSEIFKDGRTDKGDYNGPHRVNLVSKIGSAVA